MRRVGTADFCHEWPGEYADSTRTADGLPFFSRMQLFEHSTLTALLTKGVRGVLQVAAGEQSRDTGEGGGGEGSGKNGRARQ